MSLLISACGTASEISSSSAPSSLPLVESTTPLEATDGPVAESAPVTSNVTSDRSTTTVSAGNPLEQTEATTTVPVTTSTLAPTTASTSQLGPTIPVVDPNAAACEAGRSLFALGDLAAPDDPVVIESFFTEQATRWAALAEAAPFAAAAEASTVANYAEALRELLAANEWNLFAVIEEATELEVASGADVARIVVDQFLFLECGIEPPLPEQATAVFYIGLLDSADDRTFLAELLASAEVFSLEGAQCFVDRATADALHPLVGAPSTPTQDSALSAVLNACQLSIGT